MANTKPKIRILTAKQLLNYKKWNLIQIIDAILLITLITIVIYAHINGFYINKETTIIEVCNGITLP